MWPAVPPRPLLGVRLLLADDSESILLAYGDVLRRAGAEVTIAHDGAGALAAFDEAGRSEPFDAVVLDYQMPEFDGVAVAERLRGAGFDGPIVGISGEMTSEVEDRWVSAGCDRVLCKGQAADDLIACIASACGRSF